MKTRSILAIVASSLVLGGPFAQAQSSSGKSADKKQKSAAEQAEQQFLKLRGAADAKPEQATFQKMIEAGIACLEQHPTYNRAPAVVTELGSFGTLLTSKEDKGLRGAYAAQLQYAVVNEKFKPDITPEAHTALVALDAAASDALARFEYNRDNMQTLRDKIDDLARQPNAGPFLADAERRYADILMSTRGQAAAEQHLKRLLDSGKEVAEMAQKELNLLEVRKTPLALKFTGVDGKEVDCAKMRGKVVAVLFWSAANGKERKEVEALNKMYDDYRRDGLEVVSIAYDKADDKAKVLSAAKELKLTWPVLHDGKGADNELGKKLNIVDLPRIALFDKNGMLAMTDLPPSRSAGYIRRMLGIPDAPRDMSTPKYKKRR